MSMNIFLRYHIGCDNKHKQFTLIELLIVIAIISILAAVLFPALQRAKERGMTSACMNNEKSMGQILSVYMNVADGYFPVASGGATWWSELRFLLPNYKFENNGKGSPCIVGSSREERMGNGPVFWCQKYYKHPLLSQSNGETYYVPPSWSKHFGGVLRFQQVYKPEQKILLLEISNDCIGGGQAVTLPRYSCNATPHEQEGNFLFFDGHVELHKAELPWIEYSDSDNREKFTKHWHPYKID